LKVALQVSGNKKVALDLIKLLRRFITRAAQKEKQTKQGNEK
jgi:hypothetical protein